MIRPLLFVVLFLSLLIQAKAAMPERVIIHYKDTQVQAGAMVGERLAERRQRTRVLKKGERLNQVMNELMADPEIESVELDLILRTQATPTPNDPNYGTQWNLRDANFPEAWELSTGKNSVVIAIVDTGVLPHPDLAAKLLPGYDLISDPVIGNDGNGRDNNAVDSGDWIAMGDPCYDGWPQNSTWHGTHVAGIAAATTQNGVGIAGGDWNARILPVRVLGKCGGFTSDIADGIRWAVGASVAGVPLNPNPAKVVNLSLGGFGQCGQAMQSAINEANSRGAVVVVAAGNDGSNLDFQSITPANCEGVITVGASNSRGTRTGYSNFGERIDLLAPGGDFNGSILSTHNLGQTGPGSDHYQFLDGTSMATPHVSAAASLIFSVNPNLPALQVIDILKRSTRSFASDSFCSTESCGEGLLDVGEAVRIARNESPDSRFNPRPVTSGVNDLNTRFEASEKSGGCGTIDLSQNGGGGGKGGPLLLSLAFILLALESMKRRPSLQAARY